MNRLPLRAKTGSVWELGICGRCRRFFETSCGGEKGGASAHREIRHCSRTCGTQITRGTARLQKFLIQ